MPIFVATPKEPDPTLYQAIESRRLVRLCYKNKERIIEPHDYGIHKGVAKLLAYQIGGASSGKLPNWRWMETDLVSEIEILEKTFPGGRDSPTGKHHEWDRLFIRVQPAEVGKKRARRAGASN